MTSVIVLNWNEIHIVKHSLTLLLNEPDVEVIVVDNGSTDGSVAYFHYLRQTCPNLKLALLSHNTGSSTARNIGIDMCRGENIFLLDGDILYVPGTIAIYEKILKTPGTNYGCVGQSHYEKVKMTGMNGTRNQSEADAIMPTSVTLSDWFPMAWTQYGLFDGDLLRECRFHSEGCFGEYGHGYEDDWLYHEMQERGYSSIAVQEPLYLHDAHYSLHLLKQQGLSDRGTERREEFIQKWGEGNGWMDRVRTMPEHTQVPFATIDYVDYKA